MTVWFPCGDRDYDDMDETAHIGVCPGCGLRKRLFKSNGRILCRKCLEKHEKEKAKGDAS